MRDGRNFRNKVVQTNFSTDQTSFPLFEKDEALFFSNISVKHYLNLIVLRTAFLISGNASKFPLGAEEFTGRIFSFCSNKTEYSHIFTLSDDDFMSLIKDISELHNRYIWHHYINEKGRKVYMINKGLEFIKEAHNLFKLLRDKVIETDFIKSFGVRNRLLKYVDKKTTKGGYYYRMKSGNDFDGIGSLSKAHSFQPDWDKIDMLTKTIISYYDSHCSFGLKSSLHRAVLFHAHPDNMVVFDISKFFPSFTLDRIKRMRLWERNYEAVSNHVNRFKKRNEDKINSSNSFLRNAEFFYAIFDAFSYNGLLPTGAIFASAISNLLFFSIDIEIKYKIEEYIDKKFKEFEDEEVKKLLSKSAFDLDSLYGAGLLNQRVYDTSFSNTYRNDIPGGIVSDLTGIGSGIGIGSLNTVRLDTNRTVTTRAAENVHINFNGTTAPNWTEVYESSMLAQNMNSDIRVTKSTTEKELRSQIRSIKRDTFNPVYTRYVDDIAISYDLNSLARAFSFRGVGIDFDIKKFFIGMDLVKTIEKVLNEKEFFIKYDKTKIYSYKMDKEYLGYVYTGSVIPSMLRDSAIYSIKQKSYRIALKSSKRNAFFKKLYDYETLDKNEKASLKSFYYYATGLGSRINLRSALRIGSGTTKGGTPAFLVFDVRSVERRKKKKIARLNSLNTHIRKKIKYG
jgi:hypothetical protein